MGISGFLKSKQEVRDHGAADILHREIPQDWKDMLAQELPVAGPGIFREGGFPGRHKNTVRILAEGFDLRRL